MTEIASAPTTPGAQTETSQTPSQPQPGATSSKQETLRAKLWRLIQSKVQASGYRTAAVVVGWSLVVLAFLLLLPIAYLCWYVLPPLLWAWAHRSLWYWIPAVFGFLFLWLPPIWGAMAATYFTGLVVDLSLSLQGPEEHKAQQDVRQTEEDAMRSLEQTDKEGLVPLLKYSRAQLLAYYQMNMKQATGSFVNSVVAMWLGFALLLMGVALFVGPVERVGLNRPTSDIKILVMGGAAIIEFISALFLWVYQSTVAQLTYFYSTQMHSHTAILCFRMASTMEHSKEDDAKRAIIDKVMDWNLMPERPQVRGAKGLLSVLSKSGS